jgi:hypothetical protein
MLKIMVPVLKVAMVSLPGGNPSEQMLFNELFSRISSLIVAPGGSLGLRASCKLQSAAQLFCGMAKATKIIARLINKQGMVV